MRAEQAPCAHRERAKQAPHTHQMNITQALGHTRAHLAPTRLMWAMELVQMEGEIYFGI